MPVKKLFISFLAVCFLFIFVELSSANIGVGVGTGQIKVDEKLYPGTIYKLPSITIMNTGDEEYNYQVAVAFNEKQNELKPAKEWFSFSPAKVFLKPTEIKQIDIKLNLPLKVEPGDYFAYLEARPVSDTTGGGVTVGIAAAAKLYFTVVPANIFQGAYYKTLSFWRVNSPWPQIVLISIAVIVVLILIKKYLKINISLKDKETLEK